MDTQLIYERLRDAHIAVNLVPPVPTTWPVDFDDLGRLVEFTAWPLSKYIEDKYGSINNARDILFDFP